jgi:GTPase
MEKRTVTDKSKMAAAAKKPTANTTKQAKTAPHASNKGKALQIKGKPATKTYGPRVRPGEAQPSKDQSGKAQVGKNVGRALDQRANVPAKPHKPTAATAPDMLVAEPAVIENPRFGFVAIIGATNAGKSTLVNHLVGTKVTIVSHKVQTTRMQIRGIAIDGSSQLVFVDTPGIFKPRRRLDRAMVKAAWGGAGEADIVVLLFDAMRRVDDDIRAMVARLSDVPVPVVLALNKVDAIEKERLLTLAQEFNALAAFKATFMISALKGSGVQHLKRYLAEAVPEGRWHYPADDVTDAPMRILAAEITREKLYARLHQELPYAATVETTSWKEMGAKGVRLEQTIFVERDSQRSIVLGEGGRAIKQISTESRAELTEIVGRPVHLFLHVKVREGWEHDPERYREMGLEFPIE